MPRIAPIPMQGLSTHSREIVEAGVAAGLYATPIPLQIFAYRSAQLAQVDMARTHLGAGSLLGGRILELLRIRSAQLGECEPCSQSRKHDSITDDDVACLLAPGHGTLTAQEQMAVEIIELGFTCASSMGLHRFLHTLDLYGDSPPVISYAPDQVDNAFTA